MLASAMVAHFELRLPPGDNETSLLNMCVDIRDTRNSIVRYPLPTITITSNEDTVNEKVDQLQTPLHNASDINDILGLIINGGQFSLEQVLISLSQVINTINEHDIENAIQSKSTFFISTFLSHTILSFEMAFLLAIFL